MEGGKREACDMSDAVMMGMKQTPATLTNRIFSTACLKSVQLNDIPNTNKMTRLYTKRNAMFKAHFSTTHTPLFSSTSQRKI